MVGYQKDDTLTQNQKLLVGCFSGVVTRFITQPLDVIKVRTQLQNQSKIPSSVKRKWFAIPKKIFSEEGVTAFWHGHNIGQVHSIIAVGTQFYVYELTTKYTSASVTSDTYKPIVGFLCGALAGACSTTLVVPLEVIRVRQMLVKEQYRGFLNGARAVYNSGGVLAFYGGLSASLIQMGPAVGISFSVFEVMQRLILNRLQVCDGGVCNDTPGNPHKPESLLIASSVAASCAGFVSKTVTYPFDLAKKRLQIESHQEDKRFRTPTTSKHVIKCKKLSECLISTYRSEGFLGLYRGWKVTIYKAQLTSIVAFTTYELTCYALREFGL